MRLKILLAILIAVACLSLTNSPKIYNGKIVGISDGDTYTLLTSDNKEIKIRSYGIDCPEKKQAFGTQAKKAASDFIFGKYVSVKVYSQDRYGRSVGEVVVDDTLYLSRKLVELGMAWWYKQYAPKDTVLQRLEVEAREAHRGLWADDNPTAPWDWRKKK